MIVVIKCLPFAHQLLSWWWTKDVVTFFGSPAGEAAKTQFLMHRNKLIIMLPNLVLPQGWNPDPKQWPGCWGVWSCMYVTVCCTGLQFLQNIILIWSKWSTSKEKYLNKVWRQSCYVCGLCYLRYLEDTVRYRRYRYLYHQGFHSHVCHLRLVLQEQETVTTCTPVGEMLMYTADSYRRYHHCDPQDKGLVLEKLTLPQGGTTMGVKVARQ